MLQKLVLLVIAWIQRSLTILLELSNQPVGIIVLVPLAAYIALKRSTIAHLNRNWFRTSVWLGTVRDRHHTTGKHTGLKVLPWSWLTCNCTLRDV